MRKLKVLVIPSDRTGVSYYRSTNPHIALETLYPNEFHVDIDYEPDLNNDAFLKQYDIIHYHRTIGNFEQMPMLNKRLQDLGIVTIMDLDDYWAPGPHHPAYLLIKNSKMDVKILDNIKIAENVTTTTTIFAAEIAKYNKNVFVLPNAIDPTEKQFTPNLEPSDKIRIGWLGGSSHLKDLEILNGVVSKLRGDGLLDRFSFFYVDSIYVEHIQILTKQLDNKKLEIFFQKKVFGINTKESLPMTINQLVQNTKISY